MGIPLLRREARRWGRMSIRGFFVGLLISLASKNLGRWLLLSSRQRRFRFPHYACNDTSNSPWVICCWRFWLYILVGKFAALIRTVTVRILFVFVRHHGRLIGGSISPLRIHSNGVALLTLLLVAKLFVGHSVVRITRLKNWRERNLTTNRID